jgi:membrane protease YdiL (CAAX protease family)
VNVRSDTDARPSYEQRGPDTARLVAWLTLVGFLILIAYAQRLASGKPDNDVLYEYSTAVGSAAAYGVILLIVVAIAGFRADLLALRRPQSWPRALGLALVVVVGTFVVLAFMEPVLHGGEEQGLTPPEWEAAHAGAFAANFVVVAGVAPVVEELTYRGLGFSLLAPFGRWFAILAVGILFGLSHGLLNALPELALFGCALAWIRAQTRSVFPGMFVHATFNAISLIAAVTVGRQLA